MNLKIAFLAGVAAAALFGAAIVAVVPAKAEVYLGDRYSYRVDPRATIDTAAVRDWDRGGRPHLYRIRGMGDATGNLPNFVKEFRARREAVRDWQRKVSFRFGASVANWSLARDKSVRCDAGAGRVTCTVSALPALGHGRWGLLGN